jgi:hypothetical protein
LCTFRWGKGLDCVNDFRCAHLRQITLLSRQWQFALSAPAFHGPLLNLRRLVTELGDHLDEGVADGVQGLGVFV